MYKVPIEGQHVVIIGRGLTIGRPLANLLSLKEPNANATVTVCHTGTHFLPQYTKEADIIVAAAGRPSILTPDMVRPGAAVVGAGATMQGRKVVPDVDEACAEVAGWITPRLGGVGPTTRAMLLRQTVETAERRASRREGPDDRSPAGHAALRRLRRPGGARRSPVPVVRAVPARGQGGQVLGRQRPVDDRRGAARGVRRGAADRRGGPLRKPTA